MTVNRNQRPFFGLVALSVLVLLSGCDKSGGLQLAKATGMVKFKGSPVSGATVTFTYENGQVANGITGDDGRFNLTTAGREGALVGKAKVTVSKVISGISDMPANPKPEDMMKMAQAKSNEKMQRDAAKSKPKNELPEKYNKPDEPQLNADVAAKGDNNFLFELVE